MKRFFCYCFNDNCVISEPGFLGLNYVLDVGRFIKSIRVPFASKPNEASWLISVVASGSLVEKLKNLGNVSLDFGLKR